MGGLCPVGRPSAISCQPSAKDTSQKKKVFKDQKGALNRLASNIDNKSIQFVGSPVCPPLEDGFGGSINIGRKSMGTRGELHGGIPHRVHLQFRSSWQVGERTGRSEVGRAKVIQRALKPYTIYLTALNVLFCVCLAHARQSSSPEAANGVAFTENFAIDTAKNQALDIVSLGLHVGDALPVSIWTEELHTYPVGSTKLEKYKGQWLILDFWATWCSPCIAMLPQLNQLQEDFKGEVQFISVTYQNTATVKPVLQRQKTTIIEKVVNDSSLHRLFPHQVLPHFVWIDPEGQVAAITGMEALNEESLRDALKGNLVVKAKKDYSLAYERDKPLLINGNGGGGNELLYHSMISGYIEGLDAGSSVQLAKGPQTKITVRNGSLRKLFSLAYGEGKVFFGSNRLQLDVSDSSKVFSSATGAAYLDWARKNTFCYELLLPVERTEKCFDIFQRDLSLMFPQYSVEVENRNKACLVLIDLQATRRQHTVRGTPSMKVADDTGNLQVRNMLPEHIVYNLNIFYMQKSPYPIIDDTACGFAVDMDFGNNLSDLAAINKSLEKSGFKFVKKNVSIPVLTIKDSI